MNIFRFENQAALQFLWLVPVLIAMAAFFTYQHGRKMKKYFSDKIYPFLSASVSAPRRRWKLGLECLVIVLFVLALARPQAGQSEQDVKSEGVELIIVFDVSRSMLVEDVRPSRMQFAKKEAMRFLDMSGDRVGLIAFAGSGILLSPMTEDRNALKMYIESLTTESVSTQGTEFRKALVEAREAFNRGGVKGDEKSVITRAIVIISDGEDNEPGALEEAEKLKKEGIRIFTLGVGTEKGGPIPVRDKGGNVRGYRKDQAGKVVMSLTKGEVLKNLARSGGGSFNHLTYGNHQALNNLKADLDKLEKSEFESATVVDYEEKFQPLLFFGILLALIELILGERRGSGRVWKGRFEVAEQ